MMELNWVRSFGGALILLPQETLPHWHGSTEPEDDDWDEDDWDEDDEEREERPVARPSVEADFRYMGPGAAATDYDRACDVARSVAVLDAGPGQAVVLNVGAQPSGAIVALSPRSAIVVLSAQGDPTGDAIDSASIRTEEFQQPEVFFDLAEGGVTLVDSACDGRCLVGDSQSIELEPGRYALSAGEVALSDGSLLPAYLLQRIGAIGERTQAETARPAKRSPERSSHRDTEEPLFRVLIDGKWGFIDRQGRLAAQSLYSSVGDYHDGRANFLSKGRYGFLDRAGEIAIPPIYDSPTQFADGLAMVNRGGKFSYIDRDGREPFSLAYEFAGPFRDGRASVGSGGTKAKWGCIDIQGNLVIPLVYDNRVSFQGDYATAERDGRQFVIDRDGSVVCELPTGIFVSRFVDGLGAYFHLNQPLRDSGVGYFDLQGRIALGPYPDRTFVHTFSDGVAWFLDRQEGSGLIDRQGNVLIEPRFRSTGDFSEGLAPACSLHRRHGFVDRSGEFVIEPRFHDATPFRDGLAKVQLFGKWGYIDRTGAWIWEPSD